MRIMKGLMLVLAAALLTGASFNPGAYPGRYTTGDAAAASGVIAIGTSLLTGCEIQNAGASSQYYLFFDSSTVPSDGVGGYVPSTASTGWKVWVECSAASTCFWGASGPNTAGGGAAIIFANGISWSNSSTFPKKTIGTADSEVSCSYQQ